MAPALPREGRALVDRFLARRGLLGAAVAAATALSFEFSMTKEIAAQQLTGTSLYDQLGGAAGITAVMNQFVANLAGDARISAFFTSLPAQRVARLKELLIQQVAAASGGPYAYTGRDMKTAHAGLGITTADFTALVEDLVMAMSTLQVPMAAQQTLLGALAPLAGDIVEQPGPAMSMPPAAPPAAAPAPARPAPTARDGQSLSTQTQAVRDWFRVVWGDRAETRWVEEHNAEIARLGR
jgi:hemoglobin